MSSLGASKSWALGGGILKRCGEGYAWTWCALRFPSDEELLVGAGAEEGAADSRFLSESFFSRCSRWIGGGTGVLEAGREGAGAGAGVGAGDATSCANEASLAVVVVSGSACVSAWAGREG